MFGMHGCIPPGSDPYLPTTKAEQAQRMKDLVERGRVGYFLCLQVSSECRDGGAGTQVK